MITSHYRQLVRLLCLVCLLGTLNGCVGELYQSIKSDLDFPLEPRAYHHLKSTPEVVAIHYSPETMLSVEAKDLHYEPLPVDDPLVTVKDHFLTAVREHVGLKNVKAIPAPRFYDSERYYGPKMRELVRIYSHGLVLDFKPLVWVLDVSGDKKWWQWFDWDITTPSSPALLAYRVRARLLDLDQKELLWQTNCSVHTERHSMKEWMSNKNQLVKDKREELAERCAHYFIEKFLNGIPVANESPTHD